MKSFLLPFIFLTSLSSFAQTIGPFVSVEPKPQTQLFEFPNTYDFQYIIQTGDPLTGGGTLPTFSDFTGFAPKTPGNSTDGYLCINSEFVPGGVSVLDITLSPLNNKWNINSSNKVDFSEFNCLIGAGTVANCSGGITPWGTMVTCEENNTNIPTCTYDGYEVFGWNIEIDPATHSIIDHDNNGSPDKLWAMGRMKHENACFAADNKTSYYGDDNASTGYLFKFVANEEKKLGSGQLYVLKLDAGNTTGTWVLINNTSVSDRNNTLDLADAASGTLFDRVEDVEIGPDGKVYFASTGQGRIFRFNDNGSSVENFEIYVDNISYPISTQNGVVQALFSGPDNLAFDANNNLWVTQDGGDNHLWVIKADHTSANPHVEVFANTPAGCESTGIFFTNDGKFLFLSFQHPNATNTQTQTDVFGKTLAFGKETTIAIALKETFQPTSIFESAMENSPLCITPNPIVDAHLQLQFESKISSQTIINIQDMHGRIITSYSLNAAIGQNQFDIELPNLSNGTYFCILQDGVSQYPTKFVVAK